MIVGFVDPPPVSSAHPPPPPGPWAKKRRGGAPPLLLNQNVECAAGRTQLHGLEPHAALYQRHAHRRRRKALRRTGTEQHHLRCERENRLEVSGRQVGEALGLPIGDQAVRRDDAAALHALLADADLGGRVASDQVGARTRFERELHAAVTIAPVREIVIVIADLYLPQGAAAVAGAAPGIERALRFGERAALEHGWREWLAHELGRADLAGAAPACVAAAELAPAGPPAGASGTLWIATPLHLSAGAARAVLDHRGVLRLPPAELAALAAAFQDTFGPSGFTLMPLSSGGFLLRTVGIAAVATTEPARCAGGDLAAALPSGPAAAPLRRLLVEIEMWLHGQALNEARRRRGEPPGMTLWPWGAPGRAGRPR